MGGCVINKSSEIDKRTFSGASNHHKKQIYAPKPLKNRLKLHKNKENGPESRMVISGELNSDIPCTSRPFDN